MNFIRCFQFCCHLFFLLELYFPFQNLITKVGHTMSQWIYLGGVKAFADGSLGSNSALFYEVRTMVLGHLHLFLVN